MKADAAASSDSARRSRWLFAILAALLLAAGAQWLLSGGERQRIMRAVRGYVDPDVAAGLPLGELLATHPRLSEPQWTAGWSDDDHLVSVEVRVARFAELQLEQAVLIAPFLHQVAQTRAWSGVAGDQPATVQVIFRAGSGDDGSLRVQVVSLRLTEAWVVYRPEAVAEYEASIEAAIDSVDDRSRARLYRLRHEGDSALFNAGLDGPMIAGPGMAVEARAAFLALAGWR